MACYDNRAARDHAVQVFEPDPVGSIFGEVGIVGKDDDLSDKVCGVLFHVLLQDERSDIGAKSMLGTVRVNTGVRQAVQEAAAASPFDAIRNISVANSAAVMSIIQSVMAPSR